MVRSRTMAAAVLVLATAACGTAAGQTTPAPAPSPMPMPAHPSVSPADVAFMRGMIAHHGQALEMAALVPARTGRENMRLLARRIDISQQGEISMMRRWLADRGQDTTAAMMHDMHDGMPGMQHSMLMPGMLTPEEMARLAAATGPEFERLFLEGMIRHHQGALVMVEQLLAAPGAAQEPETFRFASDVDADQRAEIARMQALLATIQTPR
jgi:uncharacterized protein (DUF305 family)